MEASYIELLPTEIIEYITNFLDNRDFLSFSLTSRDNYSILIYNLEKRYREKQYIDKENRWKRSNIKQLTKLNDLEGIKYKVEKCKGNVRIKDHYTLRKSSKKGYLDIVKYLIEEFPIYKTYINFAAEIAVKNDQINVYKYLKSKGCKVIYFFQCTIENSRLIFRGSNTYDIISASKNGNLEVVKYLHSQGADITIDDNEALRLASANGHLDIVKYLHQNGGDIATNNNYALRLASENGHLEVVKYLHSQGADIFACSNYALNGASKNGHLEVVKYLHLNGVDITNNNYALFFAIQYNHLEVVKYLHQNGADISVNDNYALDYAIIFKHLKIVRYFQHIKSPDI